MTEPQLSEAVKAHFEEMFGRDEPLDPALEPYLVEDGPLGGPSLKHPLVFSVLHNPRLNAMVNQQFRQKEQYAEESFEAERWSAYVFIHERPHRLEAFADCAELMSDADYWELLGSIWTDSENIWQMEDLWLEYLDSDRGDRTQIMGISETPDDVAASNAKTYSELPSEVEVYRGFSLEERQQGLSWTTNRKVAEFFARRLSQQGDHPQIVHGRVSKSDVIACFNDRNEEELVVLPENVEVFCVESIGPTPDDFDDEQDAPTLAWQDQPPDEKHTGR